MRQSELLPAISQAGLTASHMTPQCDGSSLLTAGGRRAFRAGGRGQPGRRHLRRQDPRPLHSRAGLHRLDRRRGGRRTLMARQPGRPGQTTAGAGLNDHWTEDTR